MQEEFEDTKEVIRIHKWKKNRQHNGKKSKDKQESTKLSPKSDRSVLGAWQYEISQRRQALSFFNRVITRDNSNLKAETLF